MAKFGKYRSVNEVERAYYGVDILEKLKGVKENLQMLRREFKKPYDEALDKYNMDAHLKDNIGALNRIFEQIKRDQEKDKGLN